MPFKLQPIPDESQFAHALRLPLLEKDSPREMVADLLSQCRAWEVGEGKLSQLLIVSSNIALSLFRQCNVTEVFAHLARGLRWLWADPSIGLPTGGALTARRQRLGLLLMRWLLRGCCRPLATKATRGAFGLGRRLMAIDGTLDEVADTPANALHFGRLTSGPNPSAFAHVRGLSLLEIGTHAIIDAVAARSQASEHALSRPLLPSVPADRLLMSDRHAPLGHLARLGAAAWGTRPLPPGYWPLHPAHRHAGRWQVSADPASIRTRVLDGARHRV